MVEVLLFALASIILFGVCLIASKMDSDDVDYIEELNNTKQVKCTEDDYNFRISFKK